MLNSLATDQIERVRQSFRVLSPQADDFMRVFFTRLFTAGPSVRALLPRDSADRTQDLMASLSLVVKNLHRLEAVEPVLLETGARNQRAGVQPQHYGMIRDALVQSMRDVAGDSWTDQVQADWTAALNVVASVMIQGGGHARRAA